MASLVNTEQLDNYRIFVAIVESGSFTKAAQKLAVPKSRISRRLLLLEQQLGSQLLIRTTRKLQLTDAGQLLYKQCQPHIAALEEVDQFIYDSQFHVKGVLTLLLPLEFFNQVIGELITTFALQYPELQIQCQHYTGITPQFDHKYDLVFVLHEHALPDSQWVSKVLLSFPQSIYIADKANNKQMNELSDFKAILADKNEKWYFRDNGRIIERQPTATMILASPEMRVKACEQDIGAVKLPDYIGTRSSTIKVAKVSQPLVAQQLSVLYHSRNIPMKTRVFLDFFQSNIGCLT
ncbi:LysR family transcriptional regulator [Thalassotalea sediminis]|uniref:LysR family transcriptional regulator n=1 Tax=Thalassotalea sediminis TaxID=1759089 RepID=UPI00257314D3|nr:LysR family transcriptional regulator [Thalassotalea sediminis]